ncbi:hypothetical protein B0J12DRAFT_123006 [Macrophomina phaseolina]|uniref:Adhesin domain-containing protein n=1 Tax=Macrophomina phaseolina TaxID=35725 RepID=A0ABQ8G8M4_9PEZI|nr:hypothetical protein B0J12DRAFT_123006 [Macrophomina phaseolina]
MGTPHIPQYCQKLHSRSSEYEFGNLDELSIDEQIRPYRERHHDIRGLISLVPATNEHETKIRAKVTISNNFPHADVTAEKSDTGLLIRSKSSDASHPWHERDCTVVDVLVSVPVGTTLTSLDITSNWLSVDIHRLLDLSLDALTLDLLAGGADSKAPIPSRRTRINRALGAVTGSWALLDLLEIRTTAGMVDVAIVPGKADPARPLPAVFDARSTAGSVNAIFPTTDAALPDRVYRTAVRTDAGAIGGTYVLGEEASFESRSGGIHVTALPFDAEKRSSLRSSNGAGQSIVEVLRPLHGREGEAWRNVSAEFSSAVGQVKVGFPEEWEGVVNADTRVGSVRVQGKGLQVVGEGTHGPIGGWVRAVKGEQGSEVVVKSQTGAVEFVVGDAW